MSQEKKDDFLNILKHNLPKKIAGLKVKKVERLGGTKLFFTDGSWLLFRLSGTEPVVRIYAEAADEEVVQKLLDTGCRIGVES